MEERPAKRFRWKDREECEDCDECDDGAETDDVPGPCGQRWALRPLLPFVLTSMPTVLCNLVLEFVGSGCTPKAVLDYRLALLARYAAPVSALADVDLVAKLEEDKEFDADEFFVGRRICIDDDNDFGTCCAEPSADVDNGLSRWSYVRVYNASYFHVDGHDGWTSVTVKMYDENSGVLHLDVKLSAPNRQKQH